MEETIWITGGSNGFQLATAATEILIVSRNGTHVDSTWQSAEDLLNPNAGHCIVQVCGCGTFTEEKSYTYKL
jgi:hypothetical protein